MHPYNMFSVYVDDDVAEVPLKPYTNSYTMQHNMILERDFAQHFRRNTHKL